MTPTFAFRTSPLTLVDDVARSFEQPALKDLDPGRPLWIKINGNFNLQYPGSNTSPWFLRALLVALKDRRFRNVTVVEGDLPEFHAEDMARSTGLLDVLKPFDVPFLSYERMPRDSRRLPQALGEIQLLNVPVFHTHGQAVISCATKNLFGLLPVDRRRYHRTLEDKLLELAEHVHCATIVDGTVGLDGESTRRGDPVRCDLILGGRDVLAIDLLAARAMGFDEARIPLLSLAVARGRLRPADVTVVGDFTTPDALPQQAFRLKIGRIRKIALWVTKFDVNLEPLHRIMDPVRVTWHRVNKWRKRDRLADGSWQEYARES